MDNIKRKQIKMYLLAKQHSFGLSLHLLSDGVESSVVAGHYTLDMSTAVSGRNLQKKKQLF